MAWIRKLFGSKKGICSNLLRRTFGVTPKTAWTLSHRTHEAMRDDSLYTLDAGGRVFAMRKDKTGNVEQIKMPEGDGPLAEFPGSKVLKRG